MSSIIYHTDKKTGNVFVYESVAYRDPITKKPRNKRTYLGKMDPISGELIPKATDGHRNRSISKKQLSEIETGLTAQVSELENKNRQLQEELSRVNEASKDAVDLINQIGSLITEYTSSHT